MARRLFSLILSLQFFFTGAFAFGKEAELPYYGREFFSSRPSDSSLKELLFNIVSATHTITPGSFDRIAPGCSGKKCSRHTALGYSRARSFLLGDFYLVNTGHGYGVKDVYCDRVAEADEFQRVKPAPNVVPDATVVNTEHTWPQSRFVRGFPDEMQKSDLHHLFPTDSTVNSDRSSFDFGDVQRDSKRLKCRGSRLGFAIKGSQLVFEPPEDHKGNVARALFYFSVRYRAPINPEQEATLRKWNRLDPVDAEERSRNERIFQLQSNRNPFVDYPELVDEIRDF